MTAVLIVSFGLLLDIVGALLVANEVVRVFKGPVVVDVGNSGTVGGGFVGAVNPAFEEHEHNKRRLMKAGLICLLAGFIAQGIGAWWGYLQPVCG